MSKLQQYLGAMPTGTLITPQLAKSTAEYNKLIDDQVKKEAIALAQEKRV